MTPMVSPKSRAEMVMEDLLKSKGFSDSQVKLIQESNTRNELRKKKLNQSSTLLTSDLNVIIPTVVTEARTNDLDLKNKIFGKINISQDKITSTSDKTMIELNKLNVPSIDKSSKDHEIIKRVSTAELWPDSTTSKSQPTSTNHHHKQHATKIKIEEKITPSVNPSVEMLLSLQKAKHGISMYDIITPASLKRINSLMKSQGMTYDEAAMILFDKFTSNFQQSVSHSQDEDEDDEVRPTISDMKYHSHDSFAVQQHVQQALATPVPSRSRPHYTDKARSEGLTIKPPPEKAYRGKPVPPQETEKTYSRTSSENSMSPTSPPPSGERSKTSSLSKRNPFAKDRVVATPGSNAGLTSGRKVTPSSSGSTSNRRHTHTQHGHHSHSTTLNQYTEIERIESKDFIF